MVDEVSESAVKNWIEKMCHYSSENTPEHLRDALSRVKYVTDVTDPKGAALNFFAYIGTQLRRNRVLNIKDDSPKHLIQLLIPKLEPAIFRENMKDLWEFRSEEKKKDLAEFRKETMRTATESASYEKKSLSTRNDAPRGREAERPIEDTSGDGSQHLPGGQSRGPNLRILRGPPQQRIANGRQRAHNLAGIKSVSTLIAMRFTR